MSNTTLAILLSSTVITGCVASDESSTQPGSLPPGVHAQLVDQIETSAGSLQAPTVLAHRTAGTDNFAWSDEVAIQGTTASLSVIHLTTNDAITFEVLDASGASLCTISARRSPFAILTDSCAARE